MLENEKASCVQQENNNEKPYDKYDYYDDSGDFSEAKARQRWNRARDILGADRLVDLLWESAEPARCLEMLDAIERSCGIDV